MYFGHYNGSLLKTYGLITNRERFVVSYNESRGLDFEEIADHDTRSLSPITAYKNPLPPLLRVNSSREHPTPGKRQGMPRAFEQKGQMAVPAGNFCWQMSRPPLPL